MPRFSANLGFLWADLDLPRAIHAAKAAGFDAVECHWPYGVPVSEVKAALAQTSLEMLGLNTRAGLTMGLAAVPGRTDEARADIREAVDYAAEIGASAVHVMAGCASGAEAEETFVSNIAYASEITRESGITILIEPLNAADAPGYFLTTTGQARRVIEAVDAANVMLMFDCYHVARTEGDFIRLLRENIDIIGHIQFAGVPDRGPPDEGEVDYRAVFAAIDALGWTRPLGAEYRPKGSVEGSLGWMRWRTPD